MDLKTYLHSMKGITRREFARKLNISDGYLYQIATAWFGRVPSAILSLKIERETKGAVTRKELRPDLFAEEKNANLP